MGRVTGCLPTLGATLFALALSGAAYPAQTTGATEPAESPPAQINGPDESVQTRHALLIEGARLDYTATAGTLRIRLDKSDAQASVFYVSYRKDGEDVATRPITFVFNGGPGSSAAWLHVGALGP